AADEKGESLGAVQHLDRFGDDFHFACLHFWVFHARRPLLDCACDLKHPFHPDIRHRLKRFFRKVGIDSHLDNPISVTQIQKDDPAMVATAMHPAGKGYFLTLVDGSQFTTAMSFVHCAPPLMSLRGVSPKQSPYEFEIATSPYGLLATLAPHDLLSKSSACVTVSYRQNKSPFAVALGDWFLLRTYVLTRKASPNDREIVIVIIIIVVGEAQLVWHI